MKKILLTLILLVSQNVMALDNTGKQKHLDECFINKTCEMVMAGWIVAPGQMNVYIKKELINKINDNQFILNYFSNLLKEKRNDPMSLVKMDKNLSKNNLNAPVYKNKKFMTNLKNSNEVIIFEYESEKIIVKGMVN